jgi:ribosomal protein L14
MKGNTKQAITLGVPKHMWTEHLRPGWEDWVFYMGELKGRSYAPKKGGGRRSRSRRERMRTSGTTVLARILAKLSRSLHPILISRISARQGIAYRGCCHDDTIEGAFPPPSFAHLECAIRKLTPPLQTMLNCIDNSGAAIVECVAVMRKKVKHARIGQQGFSPHPLQNVRLNSYTGDRIIVVVQKQRSFGAESGPGSSGLGITNKVRRGDIRHAVVVRAKKEVQRKDGSLIRFDDNACVLINKTGDPIGTRLTSKVSPFLWSHTSKLTGNSRRCRCGATRPKMVQNIVTCTTTCITSRNEILCSYEQLC